MKTFEREDKLMSRPACSSSLIFHLPYSDKSIGLLNPNQGLIIGRSLFELFQGIKLLLVKLIFLLLLVKEYQIIFISLGVGGRGKKGKHSSAVKLQLKLS